MYFDDIVLKEFLTRELLEKPKGIYLSSAKYRAGYLNDMKASGLIKITEIENGSIVRLTFKGLFKAWKREIDRKNYRG